MKKGKKILRVRDRKSKLELYSSIKTNYGFEKYIDFIKDTQSRKLLTQLASIST